MKRFLFALLLPVFLQVFVHLRANNDHEVFENVTIQTVDAGGHVTTTTFLGNAVLTGIKKDGTVETLSFNYETLTKG